MNANGTAIRALRKAKNMPMHELAKAAGVSQGFLSRLERGEVGASASTLEALAKALDVAVSEITKGDTVTTELTDDIGLRLYTAEEVSELTKLSAHWLKRRGGERVIPCTHIGRALRFSAEDIRELIEMHRIDPKTGQLRKATTARMRAS